VLGRYRLAAAAEPLRDPIETVTVPLGKLSATAVLTKNPAAFALEAAKRVRSSTLLVPTSFRVDFDALSERAQVGRGQTSARSRPRWRGFRQCTRYTI